MDFLVVGFKRQQVLQPWNGLHVLAVARQDLGFAQLQDQTFRVQSAGVVMDLLRFSNRPSFEVVLDQQLQIIMVEEL